MLTWPLATKNASRLTQTTRRWQARRTKSVSHTNNAGGLTVFNYTCIGN